MTRTRSAAAVVIAFLLISGLACRSSDLKLVKTAQGTLEGVYNEVTAVRAFKGIPFAAPPVGDLRWKAPQPATNWSGVRSARVFGPRAMQLPVFSDMNFRSDGVSEDCLYLNVWTPATSVQDRLPVLVYFYGGGFVAGDGSEGRYDGESMATKGIVAVTVNYRLGVFGFLALPELTKESPHHASGNYGLLDQQAALQWVRDNIAVFGGDPDRVTIAGESAGSTSVSAHMASPLSNGLFAGAIGESGSIISGLRPTPLAVAESNGLKLVSGLAAREAPSLATLRQIPAEQILRATAGPGLPWPGPTVDGYFLPRHPAEIYAAGEQARVPLLAGVNSEEMGYAAVLGRDQPTVNNYRKALRRLYSDGADQVFKLYAATNEAEVMDAAQDLASDRWISYGTYKWIEQVSRNGDQPTFYYLYAHPRPAMRPEPADPVRGLAGGVATDSQETTGQLPRARGAVHSAEIEYAMGNLDLNEVYAWTGDDYEVSRVMQEYFANFIKNGDPNGSGLPEWPRFASGERLVIDVNPRSEDMSSLRERYAFFDQLYSTRQ